jgi:tetratricopeptide (TPR) repeat protein
MHGWNSKGAWPRALALALAASLTSTVSSLAHDTGIEARTTTVAAATDRQALWDDLGDLSFAITTSDPLAQRYFDQGLRLAYGFNHAEALRSFHEAQAIDPACALCYWGEALVLGPNINAPMAPEAVQPAFAAALKAQVLAGPASEQEKALIAALAQRYSPDPTADRQALDGAFARAMDQVAARFPADDHIAVLHAESLMNLSPWDYWQADGATPKGRTADVVATLERVLARNPDHPAAIHLYIHITEASTTPERAEPHAERLGGLMPGAGHLVHMPSHVYYRVGRYRDSANANQAAVRADEAYFAQVRAAGIYPYGYFPHNVHFIVVSAQMSGDRKTALQAAEKLERVVYDEVAREIPWVQVIKAAPYFAQAQLGDPADMLAMSDPGDGFPYVQALWHYMRAVAFIAQDRPAAARAEDAAIGAILQATDFGDLVAGGVPAPDLLTIARRVIAGRMAQAEGRLEAATAAFEQAIAVEDTLAYMEPPYWYYPLRQSLGAVQLAAGQPAAAEQAFRESLIRVPNNPWALYGLMQAYQALGDTASAAEIGQLFEKAWAGTDPHPDPSRL